MEHSVTCLSDYRRGLDWIWFIGHLYARLVTTFNFSIIPNLHILQITIVHAKSFPAFSPFTSRFPVTASNSRDSSTSALAPFPAGHSLTTKLRSKLCPACNPRHGPTENTVFYCRLRACRGRYLVTTAVYRVAAQQRV
jgi:hypothetical protein